MDRTAVNSDEPQFQPVRSRRSYEDVADLIRTEIAQGRLREGDRLPTERDLATTLGLSRNTVREAFRALEHAGLVDQHSGVNGGAFIRSSGTSVIKTALEDLVRLGSIRPIDLIEVRLVIGREMVSLACERYEEADYEALMDNLRRTIAAAEAGNMPLRVRQSLNFHKLLARASKNPVLIIITDVLTDITMEFVKLIGPMSNEYAVKSQSRLLEHLREGRREEAMTEMEEYLRTTLTTYFNRTPATGDGR